MSLMNLQLHNTGLEANVNSSWYMLFQCIIIATAWKSMAGRYLTWLWGREPTIKLPKFFRPATPFESSNIDWSSRASQSCRSPYDSLLGPRCDHLSCVRADWTSEGGNSSHPISIKRSAAPPPKACCEVPGLCRATDCAAPRGCPSSALLSSQSSASPHLSVVAYGGNVITCLRQIWWGKLKAVRCPIQSGVLSKMQRETSSLVNQHAKPRKV